MKFDIKVYSMHELGARSNQEDSLYPLGDDLTDKSHNFVLCDGMGGHDSGEVASAAVCRAMGQCADMHNDGTSVFTPDDMADVLGKAYDALDKCDTHAVRKMGTTMTFLAFHAGGCMVAHIGDSRVYHLRPGCGILFKTRDHSLVNDLIRIGELTEESAKDFDQKNVITRVMQPNMERRSKADMKEIADVRSGDYFFMCSDGINETMDDRNIVNVLLDEKLDDADKMNIIKEATKESRDNHTAFLIRVVSADNELVSSVELPGCNNIKENTTGGDGSSHNQEKHGLQANDRTRLNKLLLLLLALLLLSAIIAVVIN